MTYLLCSIGCLMCFLCGVWAGKGCPLIHRHKDNKTATEAVTDEDTAKKEAELKKQYESLFGYNGMVKK